jgi:multisubunit Na+/H+ antiporter MnhC subunit
MLFTNFQYVVLSVYGNISIDFYTLYFCHGRELIVRKPLVKKVVGLMLIITASVLLILWETKGRELVLMDEVLVATAEIEAGVPLSADLFHTVSVPTNAVVKDALTSKNIDLVKGMYSTSALASGSQISKRYLASLKESEAENLSYFVIRSEWIFMKSSALRHGDTVDIISATGDVDLGSYKVAYVKDEKGTEVSDVTGKSGILGNGKDDNFSDSSSQIDYIEILCTLESYLSIKTYAESSHTPTLLLVRQTGAK